MDKLRAEEKQSLRVASKKWTQDQWEDYLSSLESGRTETLISPTKYNELIESEEWLWKESRGMNKKNIDLSLLKKLTFKQQKVIKMIFWGGFSEKEISKKIRVTTSAVHFRKVRALRALRRFIFHCT